MPASILPDQVGADVCGLGVDAAAETGEDGDERASEGEPDQVVDRGARRIADPVGEHPVVTRDSEQSEPDDEEAGDRSGAKSDVERGAQSVLRRLGRAHVGAHRDEHADEAGGGREHGTDEEADCGSPAELVVEAEEEERYDRDERDRPVLPLQVRGGAFLDGARDLLHSLRACRLAEQPDGEADPVGHGSQRAQQREEDGMIVEPAHHKVRTNL